MRILLTGAYGNIGTRLLAGLPREWNITGLDLRAGDDPRVRVGDIRDMSGFNAADFDTVIHLAADPDESHTFDQLVGPNIIALTHFFEWCAAGGIKRIIYASSCEAFLGRLPTDGPITPDGPYHPRNVYGCAKVYAEMLLRMHHFLHGCNTLPVRIGAVLPEAMDRELANDADYQKLRLPKEELVAAFRRFLEEPWHGAREVFLGPRAQNFLPTEESLAALFGPNPSQ